MLFSEQGKISTLLILTLSAGCIFLQSAWGLEPDEVLVLANKKAARSVGLAKYYMKRRGIPKQNLLQLWVTDKEQCSREDYEKKIVPRVLRYLKESDPERRIRCLLTMYGLPLKIAPPALTQMEKKEIEKLLKRQELLEEQLKGIKEHEKQRIDEELREIKERIGPLRKIDQRASLDSEIALVLQEEYGLSGWRRNPFFAGYRGADVKEMRNKVLIVSRLDGPSSEIVKRMINDSMECEQNGLEGSAYFDARWPRPEKERDNERLSVYAFYDRSIHRAADLVKKSGKTEVFLNEEQELFQPGDCPDAALYCGWYSLARYIDAFQWKPGSVGYHIASAECHSLKQENSQAWCKRMLEEGIAATIGPVSEPYVQAFPPPELFFGLLIDGRLTLAECYALSNPFLSWQLVLIGDPLYRPFKKKG
jgi:uncharacterized protein (TIGR03790 family)